MAIYFAENYWYCDTLVGVIWVGFVCVFFWVTVYMHVILSQEAIANIYEIVCWRSLYNVICSNVNILCGNKKILLRLPTQYTADAFYDNDHLSRTIHKRRWLAMCYTGGYCLLLLYNHIIFCRGGQWGELKSGSPQRDSGAEWYFLKILHTYTSSAEILDNICST